MRTVFLWIMVVSLTLAAAMGVIVVLFERNFGRVGDQVLVTALLVGAFSLVCLACAIVLDRKKLVGLMWVGIVSSIAALMMWLAAVWLEYMFAFDQRKWMWKGGGTLTVVCIWATHIGLLSLAPLRRQSWRIVRQSTMVLATLLGLLIVWVLLLEMFEDEFGRWMAVLAILTSCGTVVSPVLSLIEHLKMKQQPKALGKRIMVSLSCPRCGSTERLPAGRAQCGGCGLRINMDIEEPLCECGYLLYELKGNRCPECGREIPSSARWAATEGSREAADNHAG